MDADIEIARMTMTEAEIIRNIEAALDRSHHRRTLALRAATLDCDRNVLPRPYVRQQLRKWFDDWESIGHRAVKLIYGTSFY